MKRLLLIMALSFVFTLGLSSAVLAGTFTDIDGHWAEDNINAAAENGYIGGYPDGSFRPDNPITRAEFAKVMGNALELDEKNLAENTFKDLNNDWYKEPLLMSVYAGIISGYPDKTIKPNDKILRQEAAHLMGNCTPNTVTGRGIEIFADKMAIPNWCKDNVALCADKGYFKGDEKNRFNPGNNMTRAEAVTIIMRYVNGETIVPTTSISANTSVISNKVYSNGIIEDDSIKSLSVQNGSYGILSENNSDLTITGCCILGRSNLDKNISIELKNSKIITLTLHGEGNIERSNIRNLETLGVYGLSQSQITNLTTSGYTSLNIGNSNVALLTANAPTSITGSNSAITVLQQNTKEYSSDIPAATVIENYPAKQKVATVTVRYDNDTIGKTVSIPYGDADTPLCFINAFIQDSDNETVIKNNLLTPFNNHMDKVKSLKVNGLVLWSDAGWNEFIDVFDGTAANSEKIANSKPDFQANALTFAEMQDMSSNLMTLFNCSPSTADLNKMADNLDKMTLTATNAGGEPVSIRYSDNKGKLTDNNDIAKRVLCDLLWYDGNIDAFFTEYGEINLSATGTGTSVAVKIVKSEI